MGKNQSASNLTNIIKQDASGNISFVSGSTTLMSVSSSGAVTTTGNVAGTASYATNANLLDGLDSTVFATTGSNTFKGSQYISSSFAPTNFTDTGSLYTDGGLRVTKNAYLSSSLYIAGDLVIFGSQSVNYITSSQLNIADNIITVNTSTPAVRFGGIAVQDSGSLASGLTGSLLWDSQNNHWIYTNPSGSSYSGGMMISGPRNTGSMGDEQGTTFNALMKGQGGDHITSSGIFESGSNVGIGTATPAYKLDVQGTGGFTGALTTGGITISNGTQFRVYNTGNGDYGNLTFATATGFTFDKAATFSSSVTAGSRFLSKIGAAELSMSSTGGPDNASYVQAYNTDTSTFRNLVLYGKDIIFLAQNSTDSERMRITSGGSIGMGTNSPNNLLSVRGNADFGATGIAYAGMSQYGALTFPRGQIMWSNTNSQNQLYIATNAYSNNNGVFAYRNSGQPATAIGLDNGGMSFLTAGNGTADAAISWTSALGIYNAGYVTKPNNPAFRAYYSVNSTWTIATEATFIFNATEYNIGSCYNTSNGRFTAPVAGVYQFNFYTIVYGAYTNAAISFRKNGGAQTSGHNVHFSPPTSGDVWSNVVYTTSMYLNASDYVYMVNSGGVATNFHGDDWSSFSGYLVG
jgi:hypothetical protein